MKPEISEFECPECGRHLTKNVGVTVHRIPSSGADELADYSCPRCQKTFTEDQLSIGPGEITP